jgi:predicted phosphate transport protein (TIGR00153 family)
MNLNFLMPKKPIFFELFNKQGQAITKISYLLNELKESNERDLTPFKPRAKDIESQADEVIRDIVRQLNQTFITPFDREDIHNLASELDDIVDEIENVLHNINIYQVDPKDRFISQFIDLITQNALFLSKLLFLLKGQKYDATTRELIENIHSLEDAGDELFIKYISHLFNSDLDAIAVIKFKDIAENLEKVTDRFQNACTTIENIYVKSW